MAKMLRWLVLLILLLSAVALGLGVMLFQQREVLKARNEKLATSHLAIAKKLHYEKLTADQLKANTKEELARLDEPLNKLAKQADVVFLDLQDTKKTLVEKKADLAKTTDELNATKGQLVAANAKIAENAEIVAKKDQEISDKQGKLTQLEGDKTALTAQVDDLNKKITKNDADITELHAQLKDKDVSIKELRSQLGEKFPIPKGTTGKILAISPEWKFCILDIGRDNGLWPSAEMLIHRGDQLIGRIRIGIVHKKVAIADILTDWTVPGATIREGDSVLY